MFFLIDINDLNRAEFIFTIPNLVVGKVLDSFRFFFINKTSEHNFIATKCGNLMLNEPRNQVRLLLVGCPVNGLDTTWTFTESMELLYHLYCPPPLDYSSFLTYLVLALAGLSQVKIKAEVGEKPIFSIHASPLPILH